MLEEKTQHLMVDMGAPLPLIGANALNALGAVVMEKVRAIVEAHPRVLADPTPHVLLDRSAAENAIEIMVAFSVAEDESAAVKSDLIKAVHTELDAEPGKPASR